jgi:hypothetical protein
MGGILAKSRGLTSAVEVSFRWIVFLLPAAGKPLHRPQGFTTELTNRRRPHRDDGKWRMQATGQAFVFQAARNFQPQVNADKHR